MLELCRCPNIYGPDCVYIYIYFFFFFFTLALSLPVVEKMEWTCAELPLDGQKVELVISSLKSLDEFYCYNYRKAGTVVHQYYSFYFLGLITDVFVIKYLFVSGRCTYPDRAVLWAHETLWIGESFLHLHCGRTMLCSLHRWYWPHPSEANTMVTVTHLHESTRNKPKDTFPPCIESKLHLPKAEKLTAETVYLRS